MHWLERFVVSIAFLALTSSPNIAFAHGHDSGFDTGGRMLEYCTAESASALRVKCRERLDGFLTGVKVTASLGDVRVICLPGAITTEQASAIYVTYLQAHPERQRAHWGPLLLDALNDARYCPNENAGSK